MTHVYEWFGFPDSFSIKCPKCKKECLASERPLAEQGYQCRSDIPVDGFACDVSCLHCGYIGIKKVDWLVDAYWTFDIKGNILWAWSAEHATAILNFLESTHRNEFDGYASAMFHIPTHFKSAKNRPLVVKSIQRALAKNNKPLFTDE